MKGEENKNNNQHYMYNIWSIIYFLKIRNNLYENIILKIYIYILLNYGYIIIIIITSQYVWIYYYI